MATTRGIVCIRIQNRKDPKVEIMAEAHVLPRLTGCIPSSPVSTESWRHLEGLELADPGFAVPGRVDVLLGAHVYGQLLLEEIRKASGDSPVAQKTRLGWIVSGPTASVAAPEVARGFHCAVNEDLEALVRRFWEQESVPAPKGGLISPEDAECEEHFQRTHTRQPDGRYVVRLPFRTSPVKRGNSAEIAAGMLEKMNRRFTRDPEFRELYVKFMREYADLGHMETVRGDVTSDSFYLSHHGVLSKTSTTTKLRVVFNGSQRTSDGISLNDCLHSGPKVQTELVDVLLRWRCREFVFSADVEKMFRQIVLHPDDRNYQLVLWNEETSGNLVTRRLTTNTYGLTSAPYLAIRVLRQLAKDEASNFPEAAQVVEDNVYVDDVLGGADSEKEARVKVEQVDNLFKAGGFRLQKWSSNEPRILSSVDPTRQVDIPKKFEEQTTLRALCLSWNPSEDKFVCEFQKEFGDLNNLTKRSVLSVISSLYDPLGWFAPVVISSKIFLQKLWMMNLQWDTPLPQPLALEWRRFVTEMESARSFTIPRWVGTGPTSQLELHGFSDASGEALGAVVYVRVVYEDFRAHTSLILSKTRVAPLKKTTIARLELSAAVLLANLVVRVRTSLRYEEVPVRVFPFRGRFSTIQ